MAQRTLSTKPTDTENRLVAFVKGTDWAFGGESMPTTALRMERRRGPPAAAHGELDPIS